MLTEKTVMSHTRSVILKIIPFSPGGTPPRAGAAFALIGAASVAWGAVSLDITKPPVTGGLGAGPPQDASATQGQWFVANGAGQTPFSRSHEFHDNVQGFGGGSTNHLAIQGNVTVINGGNWLPGQAVNSFTVRATVTNDTPTWAGIWAGGANSHSEGRTPMPGDPYVGDLKNSWLTVEFALADLGLQPAWSNPYTPQVPEIVAMNEDGRAWYCYSTDPVNPGNYFVPAWDFGTIAVNQSVFRDLSFVVNGPGILPGDLRYNALTDFGQDILMNRTEDLKIGDWVDVPAVDTGAPYPIPAARSGNASLFHIPEPSTISLLGLLGLLALRRRR